MHHAISAKIVYFETAMNDEITTNHEWKFG